MNDQLDLLSIGDASLDVFIDPTDSETQCGLDTKKCLICFPYGDKIPVKRMEFAAGGNASNNAVGTKRLGIKSSLVVTIGDDIVGNQIVKCLEDEGIDMTYLNRQASSGSNYSTVITYLGERTIFAYHVPRVYEFPSNLAYTPWVYLTSMGESFQPFYGKLVEWINTNPEVKLAFNPGSWQFKAGVPAILNVLKLTEIIFVNREEAERLTGKTSAIGAERELLTALCDLGPKISVITDGGNGSFAYNGENFYKIGILPVDPYERTGAGDAFGSGFLSAIIKGRPIEEALTWGTVNSASVIGYTGPQRGLLSEDNINEWVERAKSSGIVVEKL
jgi:sugar/nucleoside kinase (ribokinase family)